MAVENNGESWCSDIIELEEMRSKEARDTVINITLVVLSAIFINGALLNAGISIPLPILIYIGLLISIIVLDNITILQLRKRIIRLFILLSLIADGIVKIRKNKEIDDKESSKEIGGEKKEYVF